jgi:hypothetical protein
MFGEELVLAAVDLEPIFEALKNPENWKTWIEGSLGVLIRLVPLVIGPAIIIAVFGFVVRKILSGIAQAQLVYVDPMHPELGIIHVPLIQGGAKDYLGRDRRTLGIIKAVVKANRRSGRMLLRFTPAQWTFVRGKLREKLLGLLRDKFWQHANGVKTNFAMNHFGVRYNADDRRENRIQLIVVPDQTIRVVSRDPAFANGAESVWQKVQDAVKGTDAEPWIAVLNEMAEEAAQNADCSTPESTSVASAPLPI